MRNRRIFAAAMPLLVGATPAWALPGAMEGFSGVVVWLFCGYCAIIVLAQAYAALRSLGRFLAAWSARRRTAVPVRSNPSDGGEA
jgi:hypothetical protein